MDCDSCSVFITSCKKMGFFIIFPGINLYFKQCRCISDVLSNISLEWFSVECCKTDTENTGHRKSSEHRKSIEPIKGQNSQVGDTKHWKCVQ